MRISDWSSDVCSSDLASPLLEGLGFPHALTQGPELGGLINLPAIFIIAVVAGLLSLGTKESATLNAVLVVIKMLALALFVAVALPHFNPDNLHPFMPYGRSEEHTSELQSLMRISYAVFCLKQKKNKTEPEINNYT